MSEMSGRCPFCESAQFSPGSSTVFACSHCGYDLVAEGRVLAPADPYVFSEFDALAEYFQRKGVA